MARIRQLDARTRTRRTAAQTNATKPSVTPVQLQRQKKAEKANRRHGRRTR